MANSFKQMIKGKVISRSDSGMFISLDDIHVKPGFNKRDDSERLRKANDELFAYLMNGGPVPALEVVARDEGGVWLIEGHRRRQAYERCRMEGKPVDRIQIVPFVGNDVQRLARIMTSNNQLALEPLEQAALIQEMATVFNLTPAEIAKLVHLSLPKVKDLLALSTANHDVQQKVKAGEVAVNVAVDRVKEHGDKAGDVLEKDKEKAAAAGKKKVTRSVLNPEISAKKARRMVSLISEALGDDEELGFDADKWAELIEIVNEHRELNKKGSGDHEQ